LISIVRFMFIALVALSVIACITEKREFAHSHRLER